MQAFIAKIAIELQLKKWKKQTKGKGLLLISMT